MKETSRQALRSLQLVTLRRQVAEAFRTFPEGLTCDEAEELLGMTHQTCSPRVNELYRDKIIHDSGERRPTRSGRNAIVWVYALGVPQAA